MKRTLKILGFLLLVLLVAGGIWFIHHVGIDQIRSNVQQFGIWAPFIIGFVRLLSIVVPALPGSIYSVISGSLFGFVPGLIVIIVADAIACSLNFYLARWLGRDAVQKMVGERWMSQVDRLSQKYLEGNFFLLVGCLMSGFFDFLCYAVGLTQMKDRRFLGALGVSLLLAKPPLVAAGAGLVAGANGRILLGLSVLGVLGLAIVSWWVKRQRAID